MNYNFEKVMDSIKINEGLRLKPYECTKGYLSIGYGRNLETNGISQYEADMMLKNDLFYIERLLRRDIGLASHPEHVQDVLIEMAYQLGVIGLVGFTKTLELLEKRDYNAVADEMLNSKWAQQTPVRAKILSERVRVPF